MCIGFKLPWRKSFHVYVVLYLAMVLFALTMHWQIIPFYGTPTIARSLARMISSFVYLTTMLLLLSLIWRLWFMIFFSWNHWFTRLLYHNMVSLYIWILIKYKAFNETWYCKHFHKSEVFNSTKLGFIISKLYIFWYNILGLITTSKVVCLLL